MPYDYTDRPPGRRDKFIRSVSPTRGSKEFRPDARNEETGLVDYYVEGKDGQLSLFYGACDCYRAGAYNDMAHNDHCPVFGKLLASRRHVPWGTLIDNFLRKVKPREGVHVYRTATTIIYYYFGRNNEETDIGSCTCYQTCDAAKPRHKKECETNATCKRVSKEFVAVREAAELRAKEEKQRRLRLEQEEAAEAKRREEDARRARHKQAADKLQKAEKARIAAARQKLRDDEQDRADAIMDLDEIALSKYMKYVVIGADLDEHVIKYYGCNYTFQRPIASCDCYQRHSHNHSKNCTVRTVVEKVAKKYIEPIYYGVDPDSRPPQLSEQHTRAHVQAFNHAPMSDAILRAQAHVGYPSTAHQNPQLAYGPLPQHLQLATHPYSQVVYRPYVGPAYENRY